MRMPSIERMWTVDDIRDLPDDGKRYEIIDGELFVTPVPTWRQQEAVVEMYVCLRDYLRRTPVGHALLAPADVSFSPRRAVQPDVFVVPLVGGRRPESFDDVKQLLVAIEILSPATARADRVVKRRLFRDEGVAEYWIVDLDSRVVERSTPAEPRSEILVDRLVWAPAGAAAPLDVDLSAYFAAVLDG